MNNTNTPNGMNERLLGAIEREVRPLDAGQAETEQYLRRFRIATLPQEKRQGILLAMQTVQPYRRPYRRAYRRVAAAACAAGLLLLGVLLYPDAEHNTVAELPPQPAYAMQDAAELPLQPAYTVQDAADHSEFIIKAPIVFVSNDVM